MKNPPSVVIFGAGGRLGREILRFLTEDSSIGEILHPSHEQVNLTNWPSILTYLKHSKSDILINCSAKNGMEACEDEPAHAFAVNTQAPATMADYAKIHGLPLIHFSTDYACIGEMPWGIYGQSKYHGEAAALGINPCTTIIRLSSIYSTDDFAGSLDVIRQIKAGKGSQENPVRVLRQFTTPTWTGTIAWFFSKNVLPEIIKEPRKCSGYFSMAASGPVWKIDFARQAARLFLNTDPNIVEGILPIVRPWNSVMDDSSFKTTFLPPGHEMPSVYASLEAAHSHWVREGKSEYH